MSLGYAERLSFREDLGGRLGDPEILEQAQEVLQKIEQLTDLVRAAKKVVAFTGAGISTACGIPDFRGPNGVWTLQRQGKPLPKAKVSFLYAQPSLTHMALLGLMQGGKLKYICSQNVDSLHLRSGVPRSDIAELHGNCFAERCKKCKTEYVRDFEMDTVGFKPTGRMCTKPRCSGYLVDHILDWEDALPPAELKATEQHASAADVSICLGTSLQIIPAANLPLRTVKAGGSLAIINLQATPKDKKATVVIHAKVDQVMALMMQQLDILIPAYVRTDKLLLSHKALPGASAEQEQQQQQQQQAQQQQAQQQDASGSPNSSWNMTFSIASVHGPQCPLPMVASARVSFYEPVALAARAVQQTSSSKHTQQAGRGTLDSAAAAAAPAQQVPINVQGLPEVLPAQEVSGQVPWTVHKSVPGDLQAVAVVVTLQLVDAADADKRVQQLHYTIQRPQPPKHTTAKGRGTRGATAKQRQQAQQPDGSEVASIVTQVRDYSSEQQELISSLLREAGVDAQAVQQQQQQHAAQLKQEQAVVAEHLQQSQQEQAVQPKQEQKHAVPAAQAAEAPEGPSELPGADAAAASVNGISQGSEDAAAAVPVAMELSRGMPSQPNGASSKYADADADADAGSVEGLEATVEGLEVTLGQHAAACEHDGNARPSKRAKQDGDMV